MTSLSNNDTPLGGYKPESMEEWTRWKSEGPAPASWWAVNPTTGENTKVYRSYSDYADD